eukprot:Awhi_evm1s11974
MRLLLSVALAVPTAVFSIANSECSWDIQDSSFSSRKSGSRRCGGQRGLLKLGFGLPQQPCPEDRCNDGFALEKRSFTHGRVRCSPCGGRSHLSQVACPGGLCNRGFVYYEDNTFEIGQGRCRQCGGSRFNTYEPPCDLNCVLTNNGCHENANLPVRNTTVVFALYEPNTGKNPKPYFTCKPCGGRTVGPQNLEKICTVGEPCNDNFVEDNGYCISDDTDGEDNSCGGRNEISEVICTESEPCNEGFFVDADGQNCVFDSTDDCELLPCLNGGVCTDVKDGQTYTFTCECQPGFTGDDCSTDIKDCKDESCLNGGQCVEGTNSFTCRCLDGFVGDDCSININHCDPNPCLNGGICNHGISSYTCDCLDEFVGDECEEKVSLLIGCSRCSATSAYNDGCNDCSCDGDKNLISCTKKLCLVQGEPYCKPDCSSVSCLKPVCK